jgi:hypothetical protein
MTPILAGIAAAIPGVEPAQIPLIVSIFSLLINGQISQEDAATRLQALIDTSEPLAAIQPFILPVTQGPPVRTARRTRAPWSPAEDARLQQAVEEHGMNNWHLIATAVGGDRTKAQCAQRWTRGIDPKIDKRNWSFEEEQKLIELVRIHGSRSWTKIADAMGNRTDVQCRHRWQQLVKKSDGTGQVQPVAPPARVMETELGE